VDRPTDRSLWRVRPMIRFLGWIFLTLIVLIFLGVATVTVDWSLLPPLPWVGE
jgi:hypothetical protein